MNSAADPSMPERHDHANGATALPHSTAGGRLEVAWTVSARAACGTGGFGSAVLHLECGWPDTAGTPAQATVTVTVTMRADHRTVMGPAAALVALDRRGTWTHVQLRAGDDELLRASFERGRLAYCTGEVARLAGLVGATYDAPTGILECYGPDPASARAG